MEMTALCIPQLVNLLMSYLYCQPDAITCQGLGRKMAPCPSFTGGSGIRSPLVGSALCEGLAQEKPPVGQAATRAERVPNVDTIKNTPHIREIIFRFLGQLQKLSYRTLKCRAVQVHTERERKVKHK